MAKASKTGKRARKINVDATQNVSPAMLQIAFHAEVLDDAPEQSEVINNELLVIENDNNESEQDIFADLYVPALANALKTRITRTESELLASKLIRNAKDVFAGNHVSRVFFDSRVVPDFIVNERMSGKYFCQKSFARMIDVADYVTGASNELTNYTRAIFESMFRFEQAGIAFSHVHAVDCCTGSHTKKAYNPDVAQLMSCTKMYDPGTAKRQCTMSLNALTAMNAIHHRRSGKLSFYTINPESYLASELVNKLSLA